LDNSSTIFGRKDVVARPRKMNAFPPKKIRKERCDRKIDTKIKLSAEDKLLLKREARKHNLKLTPFVAMLVKYELAKTHEYTKKHFYDNTGSFVHVKLEKVFFEMVESMSDELDVTYREMVHRIVKTYIERISGIKIHDNRGGI